MSTAPSLKYEPQGRKAGVAYSQLPTDGTGDFTVIRNSNATYLDSDGLIKDAAVNVPRYEYGTGDSCPYLLTEPQSTNTFQYTEDFSNAYWLKTSQGSGVVPVVTADYAVSPDGTTNADRVQFDAVGVGSGDRSGLVISMAFTIGTTYSISCWVKSRDGSNQVVQFRIGGIQVGGEFIATNEWQRFTATYTSVSSGTDDFGIQLRGNNTVNESDILLYGIQLEELGYSTSYIRNISTTLNTRLKDEVNSAGDVNTFDSTAGVLEFQIAALSDDLTVRAVSVSDGTIDNRVNFEYNTTSNRVAVIIKIGAATVYSYSETLTDITESTVFKIKWAASDYGFKINDIEVDSQSSGSVFTANTLTTLQLDSGAGSNSLNARTKYIQTYKGIENY